MSEDGLPPLRDVIEAHELRAKKSLGQNFLLDLNITRKIARLAGARPGVPFVEVGPGPGGLTRALLMEGVDDLTVIERDERTRPILDGIADHTPCGLKIVMGDARQFNWQGHFDAPYVVVANLPYNVGTVLLTDWLSLEWPLPFSGLFLMFQEEVAKRIVAEPGSRDYGRLSVLANWRAKTEIVYRLPPHAFTPPPKVSSAIVKLIPRAKLDLAPTAACLARVTAAAFGQRRKMLRTSLKPLFPKGGDVEAALGALGIEPTLRAEMVRIDEYCRLALALEQG